jgi:hypothetical protein
VPALVAVLLVPLLLATAGPSPAPGADDQQYQDYVSTVTRDLAGLLGAVLSLQGCRATREACLQKLGEVKATVDGFRQDLDAHPAPACLRDEDARLRSALDLYQRGLDMTRQAGEAEDRGRLAQGVTLLAVGTARLGVAIHRGRQASC